MFKYILAAILVSSVAFGKPVYLECNTQRTYKDSGDTDFKRFTFNLKVDEESNTVSYSTDKLSYNMSAVFNPDTIRMSSQVEVGGDLKRDIEINRSNLNLYMVLYMYLNGKQFSDGTTFEGKCKIIEKKNKI